MKYRRNFLPFFIAVSLFQANISINASAFTVPRIIVVDPGHFHAALPKKTNPGVDNLGYVYAPHGQDLLAHLGRIFGFNTRPNEPTAWREQVYIGPDFLQKMVRNRVGESDNIVVIAGNNSRKADYIEAGLKVGHVLADKPMAINPEGFRRLVAAVAEAKKRNLLIWDIMTERHEATNAIQLRLSQTPELFGEFQRGPGLPAIEMTSIHYLSKVVSGAQLIRPQWYFDVKQQGEGTTDVMVHLIDLGNLAIAPKQVLHWEHDVNVISASRWPTILTQEQFKQVTGASAFPGYLAPDIKSDSLEYFANGQISYAIDGVRLVMKAIWDYENTEGGGDNHISEMRGTGAILTIEQGLSQTQPSLYVKDSKPDQARNFGAILQTAISEIASTWPGIEATPEGDRWKIIIPRVHMTGHEAHFGEVVRQYLTFLDPGMPEWELANLLAKYYVTTQAYELSHAKK